MFGYITANREDLKVKDVRRYESYYCGLCRTLLKRSGVAGQATLTYDMTFIVILLNGLYEKEMQTEKIWCPVHPASTHQVRRNEFTDYAADMNVLLAWYNIQDDIQDRHKTAARRAEALALRRAWLKVSQRWPDKDRIIRQYLRELSAVETSGTDNIETAASVSGHMTAEVFAFKKDEWEEDLRKMGFFIGKFVYFMDAYEDIDDDIKNGTYNPFRGIRGRSDFDDRCRDILLMQISDCCRIFERLPIVNEDVDILRNILYSGVWAKFAGIYQKRRKTGDSE